MGRKKKKTKQRGGSKRRRRGEAQRRDKYELYEMSVQEVDCDLKLVQRIFRNHFDRPPLLLREDFCGTAAMACRWVELHSENHAWGIDLDPEPLGWGRQRNLAKLSPARASRVKLIEGNVLDIGHEKVDLTVAFNFSYFTFKTRESLLKYFRAARATLKPEGLLVLDAYGGADAQRTSEERREVEGFDYVWDQDKYDPISNHVLNYIHFEFNDGSRMKRAFTYDWRLWSLPEIQELLLEAGFTRADVYWEGTDADDGEGNGVYTRRNRAADDPAWVSYIAAIR